MLPPGMDARQLAPEIRRELSILVRRLVAVGELIDDDPEAALSYAHATWACVSRIVAIREAVGIAAYRCADWVHALTELCAALKMGSQFALLALIGDCELGLDCPQWAIELAWNPKLPRSATMTLTSYASSLPVCELTSGSSSTR